MSKKNKFHDEEDSSEDESTEDMPITIGSSNVKKYIKMGGVTALLFALGYAIVKKFKPSNSQGDTNYEPVHFGF